MRIAIRREEKDDYRIVEELTREAFWNLYVPGCSEHYLVHVLRSHPDFVTELDFVAEYDGKIIGNIMYTHSYVEDEQGNRINTVTFGPVSVLPGYQRKGVGSALINHTKDIAAGMGAKAVIILGYPKNYCKHSFVSSRDFNISDPNGRFPFGLLVCELEKGTFDGRKFKSYFSPVFDEDPAEVEAFDRGFPAREKKEEPSQAEFSIAVRAYLD